MNISTQCLHLQQLKNPRLPDPASIRSWSGLSDTDASDLAVECWNASCTYIAIHSIQTPVQKVSDEFLEWWGIGNGRKLVMEILMSDSKLVDSTHDHIVDADYADAEDSDGGFGSEEDFKDPEMPVGEKPEVFKTLQALEKDQEMTEQYLAEATVAQKDVVYDNEEPSPADAYQKKAGALVALKQEMEKQENAPKKRKVKGMSKLDAVMSFPRTLPDILEKAGLASFQPPEENDNVMNMLQRARSLTKPMQRFVTVVRLGEDFLGQNKIMNYQAGPMPEYQRGVSAISQACKSFCLSGHHQSRASAWSNFSRLVAQTVQSKIAKELSLCFGGVLDRRKIIYRPQKPFKVAHGFEVETSPSPALPVKSDDV